VNPAVTQVLDYRPPLADRPLTRLTAWLATPMSPRWRTIVCVSSCLVLWGAAWLPGAAIVEWAGWIGLIICGTYGTLRKPLRGLVRHTHGLPALRVPDSERYRWHQLLLLSLAISSPIGWWPLRVNLFLQAPALERFAWHVYAEMPMSHPPRTPQMAGLFIVKGVRASPNGVGMTVMGAGGRLDYSPSGSRQAHWLQRQAVPWFLRWVIPPRIGNWSVDSTHYKPYSG
jgi:hypothetical protein